MTMMLNLLILLLFCPLASSFPFLASLNLFPSRATSNQKIEEDPTFCTELNIKNSQMIFQKQRFPNITIYAKLGLFDDNQTGNYTIWISDFYGLDLTDNLKADSICYQDTDLQCNNNVSLPYNYSLNIQDPLVLFSADFEKKTKSGSESYGEEFFAGYILNGSFIPVSGNLYTPKNPCNNFVVEHKNIEKRNMTSCCTKFLPAPKAPPAPACKKFQSIVTFYNENNTVFAESVMSYTLKDGNLHTEGNYTVLSEYPHSAYFFNMLKNCSSREDPHLKCIIPLTPGDSSLFISMTYSRLDFEYAFSALRAANVGTIIFRNGQTLIYEGIPFTSDNACVFYTGQNDANKPSISKFCCIEFE